MHRVLLGVCSILAMDLGFSGFAAGAPAYQHCANCSVVVDIDLTVASNLINRAIMSESMPLGGHVERIRWDAGVATVEIGTTPEYAEAQHLDSFDIAKSVKTLAADWIQQGLVTAIAADVRF